MDNISPHIAYSEGTLSETAVAHDIPNIPDSTTLAKMKMVSNISFEPIRVHFGVPIKIDDFYRCPELNKLVGGEPDSQHILGEAIDFSIPDKPLLLKMALWAKDNVPFDQLIIEEIDDKGLPVWLHISFVSTPKNRQEVLGMKIVNGKKEYFPYVVADKVEDKPLDMGTDTLTANIENRSPYEPV